jgi:hypothetical protein
MIKDVLLTIYYMLLGHISFAGGGQVSVKRTAELVMLCRRALDVLEDVT